MKLILIFLLTLTFFSCSKPNPLDVHIGVWAVTHGTPNPINTTDFFYLIVTQEQIDNENITLTGTKLIIKKAELCCPFISGRHEFYVSTWNDSIMVALPNNGLPRLHQTKPYERNSTVEMKKCKSSKIIKADVVGIISFSTDSISSANYMIDVQKNGTVYLQHFNKAEYSNDLVLTTNLKTRKLSKSEKCVFDELMKFHQVDTTYNPYCRNGCRSGGYFVDNGFRFKNKDFPFDHYNLSNSNMAIQGFLFTIVRRGKWLVVKESRTFCSQLKHYWNRERPVKPLVFISTIK